MRISNIFLIAILLASCSFRKEEQKSNDSEAATFLVDPITASTEQDKSDSNFNSVATGRLFNFTACVKDVALLEAIQGQKFQILEGSREIKTAETDSKGCLYWSEKISYNSLAQESYSEIERSFLALGAHKGKQSVRLAINPWKNGSGASLDLRFQEAPKGMTAQKSTMKQNSLMIDSLGAELEITQSATAAANANLRLSFEPKVRRLGIDSNPIIETLSRGNFQIRVQLFARSPKETKPVALTNVTEFSKEFENAIVKTESKIEIIKKIPRESVIEVNFEAVPVNAPEGMAPVHGVLSLGRMTSLSISQRGDLRLEEVPFEQNPVATKDFESTFDYLIGTIRISSFAVKELDSNQNPKTLELQYEACLKNAITQDSILNKKFDVQPNDSANLAPTDPESGCLRWNENLNYDYYAREQFFKREFTFQSQDAFYGSEKKTRAVYLNPWQIVANGKGIYDDLYEGKPPKIASSDFKGGSELVLNSIFFNYNERSFSIDSQLNLSVARTYRFDISPKINRITSRGIKTEGTGNGRYLVKLLLETMDKDFPEVIDAKTVEVESRADSIVATVQFDYHDIRLINTRTNLTVQILPVDRASSIESKPYTGTFDALNGFSVRLEPKLIDMDQRMKIAGTKLEPLNRNLAEYFIKKVGAEKLEKSKFASLQISDPNALLDPAKKEEFGKLCALFYDPNAFWLWNYYGSCNKDPNSYLNILRTEHVNKVHSSKLSRAIDTSNLNISASLSFNEYESKDNTSGSTTSLGVAAELGLSGKLGFIDAGIGVSYGKSWFWTKSTTKGSNRNAGRTQDKSRPFVVDEAHFDLDADIQKCVTFNQKDADQTKNYYICSEKDQRKTVQEAYYFIYQPVQASAIADLGDGVKERPFLALVRGTDRFQSFIKVLQDPNITLDFSKDLPAASAVLKESNNRFDGFFPGLLTPKQ